MNIDYELMSKFIAEIPSPLVNTLSRKEKAKLSKWNPAKSGRLIRKAANIMSDKGYVTGSLHEENGFCIRGATNYAWCGNAHITVNYDYFGYLSGASPRTLTERRNPEVVRALTDFRDFLVENQVIFQGQGVETFNDKTRDKDEVIRWMHKFADEVDPLK